MLGKIHDMKKLKLCGKTFKLWERAVLHAYHIQHKGSRESQVLQHFFPPILFLPTKILKEVMMATKQLFTMANINKVPAAICTISRTSQASIFVSHITKSPRQIPPVPAKRVDYCFPICCHLQTQRYQSEPGQLFFHILLMYWKACHSLLLLAATPEQSQPQLPQREQSRFSVGL